MNHRTKWVGVALVAFLLGGCETCQGVSKVIRLETDPEFIRYGSQGPPVTQLPDLSADPLESESPHQGNAFAPLAGNRLTSAAWTQRRIDMPVAANAP